MKTNNKTDNMYKEVEETVNIEAMNETLVNLMKDIYSLGFKAGKAEKSTLRELELIKETITDVIDCEVQAVKDKESREFVESQLTEYLNTLNIALDEHKHLEDCTDGRNNFLNSISIDYDILIRYIKLVDLITQAEVGGGR